MRPAVYLAFALTALAGLAALFADGWLLFTGAGVGAGAASALGRPVLIDGTDLSLDEVIDAVVALVEERRS